MQHFRSLQNDLPASSVIYYITVLTTKLRLFLIGIIPTSIRDPAYPQVFEYVSICPILEYRDLHPLYVEGLLPAHSDGFGSDFTGADGTGFSGRVALVLGAQAHA